MQFPAPRPRPDRDDQLIPLVNVVLLMLIFFMAVGRIAPLEPFAVSPPESRQPWQGEDATLEITVSADGRLALQGEPLDAATLQERLRTTLLQREGPAPVLRIKADRELDATRLIETLRQLHQLGFEQVQLATRAAGL